MRDHRGAISALVLSGLALSISGGTSPAAETGKSTEKPAKLEPVAGSDLMRVVLSPKAAQRLAIRIGAVREEAVTRWFTVAAEVEALPTGGLTTAANAQPAGATAADFVPLRLRVPVPDAPGQKVGLAVPAISVDVARARVPDDDDVAKTRKDGTDKDKSQGDPALIDVMTTGGFAGATRLRARLLEEAPGTDASAAGLARTYVVDLDRRDDLRPGQRVFVKVPQPGSGMPRKVVPHSAAIYDTRGNAWVYTNPEPLVFIRHPIGIDYVLGDLAVLTEGPAIGTTIVTAGAAELLGVEQKFGH